MTPSNLSDVLTRIWQGPAVSRAGLARELGLSRSAITALVHQLIDGKIVSESHIGRSSGGRPPVILSFQAERFRLVGVDLGASHISILVTDLRGTVLESTTLDHDVQGDPLGTLTLVAERVNTIRAQPNSAPLLGVGVAVPSPLEHAQPERLSPRILPAWTGLRPARILSEALDLPVTMDNDANLAALAERWWGHGVGAGDFAYIKLGTGVGAGLIIGGQVYRGSGGLAGEIGHTAVGAIGQTCRCGLEGCLEVLIGSESLEARAQQRLATAPSPSLGRSPDLATLAQAASDGEPIAVELVTEAAQALGVALANLLNLLNPDRIILGGRLTQAGDALLVPLRTAIASRAMSSSVLAGDVYISTLGRDAVALGAATTVLQDALANPSRLSKTTSVPPPSSPSSPSASCATS